MNGAMNGLTPTEALAMAREFAEVEEAVAAAEMAAAREAAEKAEGPRGASFSRVARWGFASGLDAPSLLPDVDSDAFGPGAGSGCGGFGGAGGAEGERRGRLGGVGRGGEVGGAGRGRGRRGGAAKEGEEGYGAVRDGRREEVLTRTCAGFFKSRRATMFYRTPCT